MRVLFAIHFPVFGGPHNQALRLAAPLRERGWETIAMLPDERGNAASRLRSGGVDVVTVPLHRLRATPDPRSHLGLLRAMWPEIQAIRRIIRDRGVDLVQVGGLVNPHAAIAARLERVPVVWQLLDTRAPLPLALASMAFVRLLADVVMSTGRKVALKHPGGSALTDRLVEFFPPVDVTLFRPRPELRAEVRAEWNVDVAVPVVGCVANLNPQKGITTLIEAFGIARQRTDDARLVIVGAEYETHAAYSATVRLAIERAGLALGRDVILVGERSDIERQLPAMDAFAFAPAARGEGISTAVLEAMSVGLPVVTTDVAGLGEAIDADVNGILVPPGDVSSLAHAISVILSDQATSLRLGRAARSRALASFSLAACADRHIEAYARAMATSPQPTKTTGAAKVPLAEVLICPACNGSLVVAAGEIVCSSCGSVYPVVDGIPLMIPDASHASHDELGHDEIGGHDANHHKAAQAAHFDRSDAQLFETTRPHGTPRLYRFLLEEKFRRATRPIGRNLNGLSALTICGGSGMDAEFLSRAGASVVSTDISLGAARRTLARATRFGAEITPLVADAENLPFSDASFDLVFVHDGLHHLEAPGRALHEMARVSRRWVSISEPTKALGTALAVRAGVALETEDSGNRVVRLTPRQVVSALRRRGYRPLDAHRYAMYYKHRPGSVFRALSRSLLFPWVRLGWRIGNGLVGRAGNKMVVIAEREEMAAERSPRLPTQR
jgi:glycosyltransferase involved in cell wall biosynthesis/SAM-dependent methyltransferase/uncharacterized protein YbaR (Trm112 family)